MTIAKAISKRMKQAGHAEPSAILTILGDDHNVHCLTQPDLDTWWASLDPVEKADVYEEHLDGQTRQMLSADVTAHGDKVRALEAEIRSLEAKFAALIPRLSDWSPFYPSASSTQQ